MAQFSMPRRYSKLELCLLSLVSLWGHLVFSFHSVSRHRLSHHSYRRVVELFHIDVDDFAKALESVFQGKATVLYRMRLSCAFFDKGGDNIGKGEGIFMHHPLLHAAN
jgi:hypothetical protein